MKTTKGSQTFCKLTHQWEILTDALHQSLHSHIPTQNSTKCHGLIITRLMVGLSALEGLFQARWF